MVIRTLFFILVTSLLVSCSRTIYPVSSSENLVIYPSPPDTARIQFLTRISSSRDVNKDRRSFNKFIFGEEDEFLINKPYGVTTSKGKIYVCDTYIHGIEIIDLETNRFERFIPTGKGELKIPINCFVDTNGYLYVADSERKQIVVFDENHKYYRSFGESENFKPTDVFVQDQKIWVTNLEGHQIHVYSNDSEYKLLSKFPEVNSSDSKSLFSPTNLFVSGNRIYVSDFGDFKIKIYSQEGEYIESVGEHGQGLGQFGRPKGIAVDKESNLYVVDAGFENVQIFNKDAKLLMFFGGSYKGPGDMWLPAKVSIDYSNLAYFQKYVDPDYNLKYLILVTNQYGPDKLTIYGAIEPQKAGQKSAKYQIQKKKRQ